jgi:hypothetical protein
MGAKNTAILKSHWSQNGYLEYFRLEECDSDNCDLKMAAIAAIMVVILAAIFNMVAKGQQIKILEHLQHISDGRMPSISISPAPLCWGGGQLYTYHTYSYYGSLIYSYLCNQCLSPLKL